MAERVSAYMRSHHLANRAFADYEAIVDAGVDKLVTPIHAEAHTLPFAADFFDAIVSLDAYQYFGTATSISGIWPTSSGPVVGLVP